MLGQFCNKDLYCVEVLLLLSSIHNKYEAKHVFLYSVLPSHAHHILHLLYLDLKHGRSIIYILYQVNPVLNYGLYIAKVFSSPSKIV